MKPLIVGLVCPPLSGAAGGLSALTASIPTFLARRTGTALICEFICNPNMCGAVP